MRVLLPLPDRDFDVTEVAVPWAVLREAGHEVPSGSTVLVNLSGRGDKDSEQVMQILGVVVAAFAMASAVA